MAEPRIGDLIGELRALDDGNLLRVMRPLLANRPALREALLTESASSQNQKLHLYQDSSPSGSSRPERSPSLRAVLRGGEPGGWQHDEPSARISEFWSLFSLAVFNIVLFTTVGIAYWMSIGSGKVSSRDYIISQSIDTGFPHRIGGLGISVAFIAYLYMMCTRYIAVKALAQQLSKEGKRARIIAFSKVALVFECLACIFGLGVAQFNLSFNYLLHNILAFSMFGCAVVSLYIQTLVDELLYNAIPSDSSMIRPSRRWIVVRWCVCFVGTGGAAGMAYYAYLGYSQWTGFYELCMSIALFGYYLTWLGSAGTGYIVGFDLYTYSRPPGASVRRLQSLSSL